MYCFVSSDTPFPAWDTLVFLALSVLSAIERLQVGGQVPYNHKEVSTAWWSRRIQ